MQRKRVHASRSRSTSAKPSAKRTKRAVVPRFRVLADNTQNIKQNTRVVLRYFEHGISVNPGAGTNGVYVFAANGLFDPNITGVGHQPVGFDQYMAMYNEYVVVGSTIKVSYATGSSVNQVCGISLLDFATTTTDPRVYVENGNTVWSTLGTANSGRDVLHLTHEADISKFSTQDIITEDGFSGTSGANPDDTHFYHVWVCAADAGSDPTITLLNVEIRYDVIFRDPSLNALS